MNCVAHVKQQSNNRNNDGPPVCPEKIEFFSELIGPTPSRITSQQDATQLGATQIDVFR